MNLKKLEKTLNRKGFLPTVDTAVVKDYFDFPKEKREKWGLYLTPFALPMDRFINPDVTVTSTKGWNAWYAEIKKRYPVQYFFRKTLFSYYNPVYAFYKSFCWKFDEFVWNVRRFVKPHNPRFRKAYPRWDISDTTELAVDVNFALILDFWYEEVKNGIVDWTSDDKHKKFYRELKAAVKYIEKDRPALQKKSDAELTKASNKKRKEWSYMGLYDKYDALEKEITDRDTDWLIWFIKERDAFWT